MIRGRSQDSRRRVGRSGEELPERRAQSKSEKKERKCPNPGTSGREDLEGGSGRRSRSSAYWNSPMMGRGDAVNGNYKPSGCCFL